MPKKIDKKILDDFIANNDYSLKELHDFVNEQQREIEQQEKEAENLSKNFDNLELFPEATSHDKPEAGKPHLVTSRGSTDNSSSSDEKLTETGAKGGSSVGVRKAATAPSSRGAPLIGKDAEHASARVLYETMIYTNIEDLTRQSAIQNLPEVFSCLPIELEKIKQIGQITQEAKELVSYDRRKTITRTLRGIEYLEGARSFLEKTIQQWEDLHREDKDQLLEKQDPDALQIANLNNALIRIKKDPEPSSVKEAIKLGNRAVLSEFASKIIDECVFSADKMKNINFPTEGVPNNPNTGKEQSAKDHLLQLNRLISSVKKVTGLRIANKTEKAAKKAANLLADEYFVRQLATNWNISKETISRLLGQSDQEEQKLSEILEFKVQPQGDELKSWNKLIQSAETILTQKSEGSKKDKSQKFLNDIITKESFKRWGIKKEDLQLIIDYTGEKLKTEDITAIKQEIETNNGKYQPKDPQTSILNILGNILSAQYQSRPENILKKISRHMGELFYYPALETTYSYNIDGQDGNWSVPEKEWQEASKRYNKGTKPRNNDPEMMYEVVGGHLIVIFNCFKGLAEFDINKQERMVETFLTESVLEDKEVTKGKEAKTIKGWKDEIDPSQSIDADTLLLSIQKYSQIDYQNKKSKSMSSISFNKDKQRDSVRQT